MSVAGRGRFRGQGRDEMANVSRGRRLLMMILAAYLAGVAWLWVRYPASELEPRAIQIGLWGALPTLLAFLACLGAGWARRALAVVWGLHGALLLLFAQWVSGEVGRDSQTLSMVDAGTYAGVAIVCLLAAVV